MLCPYFIIFFHTLFFNFIHFQFFISIDFFFFIHLNVFYFRIFLGADLTPYYLFDEDAIEFHKKYKEICNINGKKDVTYNICKQWCDDYFYLPARKEHRGIGGIFFDDLSSLSSFSLPINRINMTDNNVQNKIINGNNIDIINKNEIENENDPTNMNTDIEKIKIDNDIDNDNDDLTKQITESELNEAMTFTKAVCDNFMPSYLPIVRKRKNISHSEEERYWQLLRRGRYIEFNLLYDRGVKFGLVPGGVLLLFTYLFVNIFIYIFIHVYFHFFIFLRHLIIFYIICLLFLHLFCY